MVPFVGNELRQRRTRRAALQIARLIVEAADRLEPLVIAELGAGDG